MLNCLPPSHWREWPPHIRFARHHGLILEDTICLAQIADGYCGVLGLFGLAAHSAGRPGIYVALENRDPEEGAPAIAKGSDIMVRSRDRAGDRNSARALRGGIPAGLRSAPPESVCDPARKFSCAHRCRRFAYLPTRICSE